MTDPTAAPRNEVHPFEGRDINWLLDYRSGTRSEHPFLIWEPFVGEREIWTYGQFSARVLRLAAGLHARGIGAGDAVLVHLDTCPEFEAVWFACARIGAIAVTTNTRSAGEEIAYFAENCKAVAAITGPDLAELVTQSAPQLRWIAVHGRRSDGEQVADLALKGIQFALADLDAEPDTLPVLPRDPWRLGSVQYTSGTTSRPKGVLWTHGNALWGAKTAAMYEQLDADSIHLVLMPGFHTNARTYSILPTMWAGGTAVITPKFSASRFWPLAVRNRCTHASMLRFFTKVLLDHPVPASHHFKVWNSGAADDQVVAYFRVRSLGHYGSTETVAPTLVTDLNSEARNGTVGYPAAGYGVRVVDDRGRRVAVGEAGHLQVRGVRGIQLFVQYLNSPETTDAAFTPDGWFITGDRAQIGPDGAVSFVDRLKDVLKIAGENVSALEVERVIVAVDGVAEAAVVGKPDDKRGEVAVAFVRPAGHVTPDQHAGLVAAVQDSCRAKLANFKVPQQIHVLADMPRAELEKINKVELRRRAASA